MKKMMVIGCIAACFAAGGVLGADNADIASAKVCVQRGLGDYYFHKVAAENRSVVDDILSKSTNVVICDDKRIKNDFPKCFAKTRAYYEAKCPKYYEMMDAVRFDAQLAVDTCDILEAMPHRHFTMCRNRIVTAASKNVKKYLRSKGLSVITRNGVNPLQVRVDAVTAALNKPRWAGIKEALAGCGLNFGSDLNKVFPLTDAEVNTMRTDMLNGDVEMTDRNKTLLLNYLGVEAYNVFVDDFNKGM